MERIVELVSHKTLYPEICMQLQFIKEKLWKVNASHHHLVGT